MHPRGCLPAACRQCCISHQERAESERQTIAIHCPLQLRGTHTDVDRPQSIGPGPIVSTGSQSTDQFFDLGRPQLLRAVALIGAGSESIRAPNRWGPWSHRLAGRIDSGGLALSRAAQSIRPASRRPERPRHCDRWSRRRGRAQSIRRAPIDGASRIT